MAQHSRGDSIRLIVGPLNATPAAGPVTDTDLYGAYIKQITTNTESILVMLGGAAGQMRVTQSVSATVEENAYQQFSISIMDVDSGAVAEGNIDIAGISQVLSKSTGGGAFSSAGITQPTFGKADGRVFEDYRFLAAEWAVGDVYKLVVSGITCTIGGDTAYIPAMVWSNLVVEQADLQSVVNAIRLNTDLIAITTIDLNQAAGTYDLLTGGTADCLLESLIIQMPTEAAGGSLTSIAIQTDDVTPAVIINATDGAVGNLTSEAQISWIGAIQITVATKIRLTIGGGAHGSSYVCKVTAKYRAIGSGGVLA